MRARSHGWGRAGFVQQLAVTCQRLVPKPAPTDCVDEGAIARWGRAGFVQQLSVTCQRLVPKPAPTGYVDEGAIAG